MAKNAAVKAMPMPEVVAAWEHVCAANCAMRIVGNRLVIEVDLVKDLGPSKSGKTRTVGSTNGFVSLAGAGPIGAGVVVALNVNRMAK